MFTNNILFESAMRQGLPHVKTMTSDQFKSLISTGKVHLDSMTEKTDGIPHKMGWDENGFYTQASISGKEKMRSPQDYLDRAHRRSQETGKPLNLGPATSFGKIHDVFHKNKFIQNHLQKTYEKTGEESIMRGELYYKPLALPSETSPHEMKFVLTPYDTRDMGKLGKYVIHTKLPENKHISDIDSFKKGASDKQGFVVDDDIIPITKSSVNVAKHKKEFDTTINHDLINAKKTKENSADKEVEELKFSDLKERVSGLIDNHIRKMKLSPKWGSGSEGMVIHPSDQNPEAPRFKVTSDAFRQKKEETKGAGKIFADRVAKPIGEHSSRLGFKRFILEGGNIKIGDVSAENIPISKDTRGPTSYDAFEMLSQLHDKLKNNHGIELFGKNKKALKAGSAFSGSSKHLMNPAISDEEFASHKSEIGDLDVQIPKQHKEVLSNHLKSGGQLGQFDIAGSTGHGNEVSALMRHKKTGKVMQVDFENVDYANDEPTPEEQFLHSSAWEDNKLGIKGFHHKILINAAGLDKWKFSLINGLRSRSDESDLPKRDPNVVSKTLFGNSADHSKVHSFVGVTDLIKKHIPKSQHQDIYNKFEDSVKQKKKIDSTKALQYLKTNLLSGGKKINEATESEHHASVIPLVGFSPISHMGHAMDLGGAMKKSPGKKWIGISSKADVFDPAERATILKRQWNSPNINIHIGSSGGETIGKAYKSLPKNGKKHLHIVVGADRVAFAEGLKRSLENGGIKEMDGNSWDSVQIHTPEDSERSHGLSGTNMRLAATMGDKATFSKHLGPMFDENETINIMDRVKKSILTGKIKLKRNK